MIRGFHTAGAGLISQQMALDNTANNIANVSTTGYKKQELSFSELLYSNIGTDTGNIKVGIGSRGSLSQSDFTQGSIVPTERKFDFAIESNGFFGVKAQDGSIKYTRDGSFAVSVEGDGNYLVDSDGGYVLDENGDKLSADEANLKDKIGVFDFSNSRGLRNVGNNHFEETAQSGSAQAIEGNISNGSIELSNVELNVEMTDLLEIQRAYQFNSKFIQTSDEIENITNNLK